MKAAYPKNPKDIRIHVIRQINSPRAHEVKTTAETFLSVKLYDYVVRLGYSSVYMIEFVVQLFAHGKVVVDFPSHTERMELSDSQDKLSSSQAISLLEDFIASIKQADIPESFLSKIQSTQHIVVQRSARPEAAGKAIPGADIPKEPRQNTIDDQLAKRLTQFRKALSNDKSLRTWFSDLNKVPESLRAFQILEEVTKLKREQEDQEITELLESMIYPVVYKACQDTLADLETKNS